MHRAPLLALVALVAPSGGCESAEAALPTGELEICAQVSEDFRCRMPSDTVAPRLTYEFVVTGPEYPTAKVQLRLVELRGDQEREVFDMHEALPAGSNTYHNNFQVADPGRYRLELRTGAHLYASKTFVVSAGGAERHDSTERRDEDPTAQAVAVQCADACPDAERELLRIRTSCVEDPVSQVRRALPSHLVAAGCCGFAAGAYENACTLSEATTACVNAWNERCPVEHPE